MVLLGSGSQREVTDYHLTRYGCYLVAMNSDPRKAEVSQAQTYFAVKTREAEMAQEGSRPNIHKLSDAMKPRALENLHRVPEGYFSVMGELFRHLFTWKRSWTWRWTGKPYWKSRWACTGPAMLEKSWRFRIRNTSSTCTCVPLGGQCRPGPTPTPI